MLCYKFWPIIIQVTLYDEGIPTGHAFYACRQVTFQHSPTQLLSIVREIVSFPERKSSEMFEQLSGIGKNQATNCRSLDFQDKPWVLPTMHSTTKKVFFLPSVFPASLCLTWKPSEEVSLQTSCARAHQRRVDTVTSQSAPGRSRPPDATLCCSSVVRRRGRRRCLAVASCSTFERFEQCSEEPCTCNNPGRSKCFFRCIFGTTPWGNRNALAWRRHGMVSGGTRLSCVGVLQRLGNAQGKSARGHFFLWIPRNADTRSLLRWPTEACQWTSKNDFWSLLDPSFGLLPSWLL